MPKTLTQTHHRKIAHSIDAFRELLEQKGKRLTKAPLKAKLKHRTLVKVL